jgi:hypothetical protein
MKIKSNTGDKRETPDKTNFFVDVFDVVRQIPKGRVTNYGSIAKYLGSGLSSRMVSRVTKTLTNPNRELIERDLLGSVVELEETMWGSVPGRRRR